MKRARWMGALSVIFAAVIGGAIGLALVQGAVRKPPNFTCYGTYSQEKDAGGGMVVLVRLLDCEDDRLGYICNAPLPAFTKGDTRFRCLKKQYPGPG